MKALTEAQRSVLQALVDLEAESLERYRGFGGTSARQVARKVWPNDPGWARWTAGRGATSHNGAKGATMPLRAGRVLSNIANLRDDAGCSLVWEDDRRWGITRAGRQALQETS